MPITSEQRKALKTMNHRTMNRLGIGRHKDGNRLSLGARRQMAHHLMLMGAIAIR